MFYKTIKLIAVTMLMVASWGLTVRGDDGERDNDYDNYDRVRIDRYLDAEVWTSHSDGEYYVGDNIAIHFRVNRDAFVAIYSVDTRGRVDLLFPSRPDQSNFLLGGVTYSLPDGDDDFDLEVTGPEGVENIQIIASREKFPIPDWYQNSGMYCDWEDRHDYLDYVNRRYFVKYDGQRFAYDRDAAYVYEWEPQYFRPVYFPHYPSWTVCGNMYLDYPAGATIYINGRYWGCAPMYIPHIYVGWHTFTIYDRWGYCWESDIHITRYNTVIINETIIRPQPHVVSKYKQVRFAGYRDPISHGYPKFNERKKVITKTRTVTSGSVGKTRTTGVKTKGTAWAGQKSFVRGSAKMVKTDRGFESAGITHSKTTSYRSKRSGQASSSRKASSSISRSYDKGSSESSSRKSSSSVSHGSSRSSSKSSSSGSISKQGSSSSKSGSGYYRKKTGSSSQSGKAKVTQRKKDNASSKSKSTYRKSTPSGAKTKATKSGSSGSSKKSSGSYKTPSSSDKSAPATKSNSGGSKKSSSGSKSKSGGSKGGRR